MSDSQWIFLFYEQIVRKAPGSEASTLKALSMLTELPPNPRILDLGCGSGVASLVLAQSLPCQITALDLHQPFLDQLETLAERAGLSERITTLQADIVDLPFPAGSFDLIWSEGALYVVGFEEGLRHGRRLLQPGGLLAVTEVTWLSEAPPQHIADFWAAEYPAMTSLAANLAKLRSSGFEPLEHFTLPAEDWQNYYGPLEEQLAAFRSQHVGNADVQAFLDGLQREIEVWQESAGSYGYVFYLGRAV